MTKLEEAKARLAAAQEDVKRFEADAAFMAKRKELEAVREEAEAAVEGARDARDEAWDEAGIALGFYVKAGGLRQSFLDVIARKIGVSWDDREVLARANRYHDDPFGHAANAYARREIQKAPTVVKANRKLEAACDVERKANEALYHFTISSREAERNVRSAEYAVREATKEAQKREEAREKLGTAGDRESVKAARDARRILAQIEAGEVKLEVKP